MRFRINPLICFKGGPGDGPGHGGESTSGSTVAGSGEGAIGPSGGNAGVSPGSGTPGSVAEAQANAAGLSPDAVVAAGLAAAAAAQAGEGEGIGGSTGAEGPGFGGQTGGAPSNAADPLGGYSQADIATAMAQSDVQAGEQADISVAMAQSDVQAAENNAQLSNSGASASTPPSELTDIIKAEQQKTFFAKEDDQMNPMLDFAILTGQLTSENEEAVTLTGQFARANSANALLSVLTSFGFQSPIGMASSGFFAGNALEGFNAQIADHYGQNVADQVADIQAGYFGSNTTPGPEGPDEDSFINQQETNPPPVVEPPPPDTNITPGLLNKPKSISTDVYGLLRNKDRRNWRIL